MSKRLLELYRKGLGGRGVLAPTLSSCGGILDAAMPGILQVEDSLVPSSNLGPGAQYTSVCRRGSHAHACLLSLAQTHPHGLAQGLASQGWVGWGCAAGPRHLPQSQLLPCSILGPTLYQFLEEALTPFFMQKRRKPCIDSDQIHILYSYLQHGQWPLASLGALLAISRRSPNLAGTTGLA